MWFAFRQCYDDIVKFICQTAKQSIFFSFMKSVNKYPKNQALILPSVSDPDPQDADLDPACYFYTDLDPSTGSLWIRIRILEHSYPDPRSG